MTPRKNVHWKGALRARAFTAPIGRGETRDALNLRVVLPAVKREDLLISVEGGTLHLRGERRLPQEFAEDGRCRFALPYGVFAQDVVLPDGLDLDNVRTNLHDGVLDIRIPFAQGAPRSAAGGDTLPDSRAAP